MKLVKIIICAIVIALLIPTTTAFAAETELVITSSDYKTLCMTAGDKVVFCAERAATTPHAGVAYTKINSIPVKGLEEVAINSTFLDDSTAEFNTATQYAVWQCLEPNVDMVRLANLRHNDTVGKKVEEILTASTPENFRVEISFYEADGYQTICTWEVVETFGEYNPPETEAPTTEAPETEAPTEAPTTEAPETEAPTEAPTTEAPETEAPTEAPTTEAPETEAPTTEAPTEAPTETPETEAPTTETPELEPTDATSATGDHLLGTVDVPNTGVNSTAPIVSAIIVVAAIATIIILLACKKKKVD